MVTVQMMAHLAGRGACDPRIRAMAASIAADAGVRDVRAQIAAFRWWLVTHFRFIPDPVLAETLHEPLVMFQAIDETGTFEGDCDDAAILASTLAASVAIRSRFCVLAFGEIEEFAHIYCELQDPATGEWLEMDVTTRPDVRRRFSGSISRRWYLPGVSL
jgi:transglutaminase-like putative cysteine protease